MTQEALPAADVVQRAHHDRDNAEEFDGHLRDLAVDDRFQAALERIDDRDGAQNQHRLPERHVQNRRQHQADDVGVDARGEGATHEEQRAQQQARLSAEALLEERIDAHHARAVQHRADESHGGDHRERHAELEREPLQAAALAQADERRRRHEADGGQLRRHRRHAERKPAKRSAAQKVVAAGRILLEAHAEPDHGADVQRNDSVVERVHARGSSRGGLGGLNEARVPAAPAARAAG